MRSVKVLLLFVGVLFRDRAARHKRWGTQPEELVSSARVSVEWSSLLPCWVNSEVNDHSLFMQVSNQVSPHTAEYSAFGGRTFRSAN